MKKTPLIRTLASIALALCFSASAQTKTLTPLSSFGPHGDGSLQPGDVSFVTSGAAQRGVAYNPVTGNIIFVDREADGSGSVNFSGKIYVLDGTTAQVIATLSTNGIAGGNYADYAVQVDDNGVIYVGNLVNTGSSLYKLYRWDSESSTNSAAPPVLVYSGDPGNGIAQRWGATMDLRGTGASTQILLGSQTQGVNLGTNVAVLTTLDGTNFTAKTLSTDIQENDAAFGIAFGAGNTFWTKHTIGHPFRQLSFDVSNGTASTIRMLGATNLPAITSLGPIAVDVANNLLATMEITTGANVDTVRLYDISNPSAPLLLDIESFPVDGGNVSASAGFLEFGGGKLYAHSINSGLLAFSIDTVPSPAPTIVSQPVPLRKAPGQNALFEVLAYPATGYQWFKGATAIPGATNSVLNLINVQAGDAGDYSMVASNATDSASSSSASLSVLDPTSLFRMVSLWSLAPGQRSYVNSSGGAGTPNQRALGYNPLSNEVYIVSRGGSSSANFTLAILNATNGLEKGFLKTNGVTGGSIGLVGIAVAADGSIYMANEVAPASSTNPLKIYRWANSDTNTDPQLVYSGVPDTSIIGSPTGTRWGDNLAVRGSGINTEILMDNFETTTVAAKYVVVLKPSDEQLTNFVATGNLRPDAANLKIGRSLQWGANDHEYYTKKSSNRLELLTFDADSGVSGGPVKYTNFPVSLGPVAMDFQNHLLAGINYAASSASPQQLVLYEVSDLSSPLLLDTKLFPANKVANNNAIGNVVFGDNVVFALDGNNGVVAFRIETGPPSPPFISKQPASMRLVSGGTGTLSVTTPDTATFQWRFNGTNISGATSSSYTISNAQLTNAGSYSVLLSNVYGGTLSSNATVTVTPASDTYHLAPIWSIAPGTRDYFTVDPSNTPNQRSLAYNALSNQVLLVSRTTNTSGQHIIVLDAANGNFLHELDTTSVTPVAGQNIILSSIGVADDGAIYAGNVSVTSGTANPAIYNLYRWADSASNTVPTLVFSAEPAGQSNTFRWGDSLDVRGSGINTEIILDESNNGDLAAILKPADASMITFTNTSIVQHYGKGSIGRSLQFASGNTFWQKRHSTAGVTVAPLLLSSYDPTNGTSMVLTNYTSFPSTVGAIEIDSTRNLAAALDFSSTSTSSNVVALYEISDLTMPMLLGQYSFPTSQQPNANFIGQSVFAGNKVFSLIGNNGMVAFDLVGPFGAALSVSQTGSNVQLSWTDGSFILQAATNLNPPIAWTDLSTAGQTNVTENASSGNKFYRLKK